ncbi:hypothetical protein D3C74_383690 [compost metagenome]
MFLCTPLILHSNDASSNVIFDRIVQQIDENVHQTLLVTVNDGRLQIELHVQCKLFNLTSHSPASVRKQCPDFHILCLILEIIFFKRRQV